MVSRTIMGVAFAAGCALALGATSAKAQMYPEPYAGTQVVTNGPQPSPGDFNRWSAHRNNLESAQYERLLQTNPGFRHARMQRECSPITDPQLRAQCLASFGGHSPEMTGSSTPPDHWR